ncbi:MAG: HEAT repeat domain-containing protein [Sphingobacteriales bacterium]|nr:HEAT repeat domain-containing protein [Sphingobacteriales bacterium]
MPTSKEEIENVLILLLEDDDVVLQALNALQKFKPPKIKGKLIELLQHPISVVRKQAKKLLSKIE